MAHHEGCRRPEPIPKPPECCRHTYPATAERRRLGRGADSRRSRSLLPRYSEPFRPRSKAAPIGGRTGPRSLSLLTSRRLSALYRLAARLGRAVLRRRLKAASPAGERRTLPYEATSLGEISLRNACVDVPTARARQPIKPCTHADAASCCALGARHAATKSAAGRVARHE